MFNDLILKMNYFKVLPRLQSFAPWHYYLKVAFILGVAFGLEWHMHTNVDYRWQMAAVVGLFYALIGREIHHET